MKRKDTFFFVVTNLSLDGSGHFFLLLKIFFLNNSSGTIQLILKCFLPRKKINIAYEDHTFLSFLLLQIKELFCKLLQKLPFRFGYPKICYKVSLYHIFSHLDMLPSSCVYFIHYSFLFEGGINVFSSSFIGQPISGHLSVTKCYRVETKPSAYTLPNLERPGPSAVRMPEGLKQRFTPFGSSAFFVFFSHTCT